MLTHAHRHTGIYSVPLPHISPSHTPSSAGTCWSSNFSHRPFLFPPQHPLSLSFTGMVVRPMKMLAYHKRSAETPFSAVPNCRGGGKGRSWQRLYKYLLSNNTAGSRAPSFSWLICHPRDISAGTRHWLWSSPLHICWPSMPPFKLFHRLTSIPFDMSPMPALWWNWQDGGTGKM